jgi:phage terminase large subunit-like protein
MLHQIVLALVLLAIAVPLETQETSITGIDITPARVDLRLGTPVGSPRACGSSTCPASCAAASTRRVVKFPYDISASEGVEVEGPAGILNVAPAHECPEYRPSTRLIVWPNGSWATLYSG